MKNIYITVKIYSVDKKLIGIGQLLNLSSDMIKIKGVDLPELDSNTEINIEIYDELRGIMPYFCRISVASENQLNALIIRKEPIIERRNSLKVKTNLSFYTESFHRSDEEITDDFPNMKINILNLSIGGMLISCNYDLIVSDIIAFNFIYLKSPQIKLKAKVIRIDKVYDRETNELTGVYYGCIFKNLSRRDESVITKYLYDRQLQLFKNR